jgi:hypothetical protein
MASQNRTHASDRGKAIPDLPGIPTIGTATAGVESASVAFTASNVGGLSTSFTALSNPGSVTGTGTSPITVSGLTAGTAYTFTVRGNNATGSSEYSSASNSITPTISTAYESIATVTVGSGGSSSISFSSIPSTFKHLQIRYMARSTVANVNDGYTSIRFNGDTTNGNYYFLHFLQGDGTSAVGGGLGTNTNIYSGVAAGNSAGSNVFGVGVIDISDYTSTNKYKVVRALGGMDNNGAGKVSLVSGNWFNTAAVTSITMGANAFGNNFTEYSKFALYGIKGE